MNATIPKPFYLLIAEDHSSMILCRKCADTSSPRVTAVYLIDGQKAPRCQECGKSATR